MADQNLTFAPHPRHYLFVDLTGKTFSRLTVLGFAGSRKSATGKDHLSKTYWWCRCKCGNICEIQTSGLTSGKSQSCGCYKLDGLLARAVTHGHNRVRKRTLTYNTWVSMVGRCHCETEPAFAKYGSVGIIVCDRWRFSFENFLADMGERPSKVHTIDRFPDRTGNYEPGNCRWATKSEQAQNRKSNQWLTFDGQTRCQVEWARLFGMSPATLCCRLKRGMSIKDALTTPTKHHPRVSTNN